MDKKYLNYRGLSKLVELFKFGHKKIWHGTKSEWDALSSDEKEKYDQAEIEEYNNIDTSIVELIYPVGSIYINIVDVNPANIFGFGTWERVANNKALWGASTSGEVGTEKAAGLPNITGQAANAPSLAGGGTGAFYRSSGTETYSMQGSTGQNAAIYFSASRSNSIYGNSTTVQPPALVVNIWKRTA